MLINFNLFYNRFALRKPINLLNPIIHKPEEVTLPKLFTYHLLDKTSEVYFPSRSMTILKDIPEKKRVYIHVPLQYIEPQGSYIVKIRNPISLYRKWLNQNKNTFRDFDPERIIPNDQFSARIVDYNLLANSFKYTSIPINKYYEYFNISNTLYKTVSKFATLDPSFKQIFRFNIPNIIPSFPIITRLMNLKPIRYTKVVRDPHLMNVIEFMKWIQSDTVNFDLPSVFSSITEENTKSILVEFYYKDFCCYVPLSLIYGIKESSNIDSSIKTTNERVCKIFFKFLLSMQSHVNGLLKLEETYEEQEEEEAPQEDIDELNETEEEASEKENRNEVVKLKANISAVNNVDENIVRNINDLDNIDLKSDFSDIDIDKELEDNTDDAIDETFMKALDTKEEEIEVEENDDTSIEASLRKNPQEAQKLLDDKDPYVKNEEYITLLARANVVSNGEVRTIKKLLEERKKLKSPYIKEPIDEHKIIQESDKVIDPELRNIPIDNTLVEDSLKKQTISSFNKKYNSHLIKKDIVAAVTSLERSNLIVKSYEIEESNTAMGQYETHRITFKPIKGNESTVYMRLPKVNEEGEFMASGVKLIMRKQRSDLPIRKIAPDRVALTSYYGKLFIERTPRKQYNFYTAVNELIRKTYLSSSSDDLEMDPIVDLVLVNIYNNKENEPSIVSSLKQNFSKIQTKNYTIILDNKELLNHINRKVIEKINQDSYYCVGYNKDKNIVVCDDKDLFYIMTDKGYEKIGTVRELFSIQKDLPRTFTETSILGKSVPIGPLLSYYLGFSNLVKLLNVEFKVLESSKRYTLQSDEAMIRFSNYKFIYKTTNKEALLLLAGFDFFKNFIKEYEMEAFDNKDIYYNIFSERGMTNLHLNEFETLKELFLDPITIDVLKDMKEPYEFLKLLMRANQMLVDFKHPDINDANYIRIKSTERIPGLMYRVLAESVRNFRNKKGNKSKIELDPYAVWNIITKDNAVKITEEINPIVDLKEMEAVTYSGIDGLNKDNVPLKLREYSKSDMGLISEATVDSSDVAVNTYLTPDAKFKNIRGQVDPDNKEYLNSPEKLLSTSALLSSFTMNDDPKRVNFINIQNGHTIATEGYHQPIIRTGYEYVMPYRVGELYCVMAQEDGEVTNVTNALIVVKYKTQGERSYKLGRQYGVAEGTTYPHFIVTLLSKGSKFKTGDCICYNTNFFEPDWINPKRIIYKTSKLARVALTETNEVYEDSSAVSSKFSENFKTHVTKVKSFVIEFNKNIINLQPKGKQLEPSDILFTIVEEGNDYQNLDKDTVRLLQALNNISPKAKYKGILEKYEMVYNGDKEDMSPSLRKLADELDTQIYNETKGTSHVIKNGRVDSEYRVEGKNLQVDTLELRVYINIDIQTGIGDKVVFASQLKSVVGNVMSEQLFDESGREVDALFGFRGIYNRVTVSPILMGTTNTLMLKLGQMAVEAYNS